MSIVQEFKQFAMRGNVVDLAVAVIIGAEFGKVVNSFVNDILMPPLGVLIGGLDFKEYKLILIHTAEKTVTLNYGSFIQSIINFTIIAFAIFMMIKLMNTLKKKEAAAPPAPTQSEILLTEIRDLLKTKKD
ncbi:MAG: large-conductance mechanosensitive channel protein MscL [Bacteroidota bacterium]|nr:large-conductance mechanosensitive channel protein MscL [Bacteroidota bacterium]